MFLYDLHDADYTWYLTIGVVEERKVAFKHHAHVVTSLSPSQQFPLNLLHPDEPTCRIANT